MNESIVAKVDAALPLTNSILQVILKPEVYIPYQAGQYLQILLGNEVYSYSIANAPLGARFYELHIRHSQDNPSTQRLLEAIKQQGEVKIKLPLGECHLEKLALNQSILFIAGGTGFAPIKSMIEQLLASGDKRPFELFWGAHAPSDLYLDEKVRQWQTHVESFRYFSLLSGASKQTLAAVILDHHFKNLVDLQEWQVVIAGPFEMVYAIRDALIAKNVPKNQLFSDAFSFEKRANT